MPSPSLTGKVCGHGRSLKEHPRTLAKTGEMALGAVWVAEGVHGFTRIDPATNQVETLLLEELDHAAQLVATTMSRVWSG